MALSLANYSFTALINDDASGLNAVPSQAVTVKIESTLALATIYSDSAGTTPITQPGAITDSNGVLEFWVQPGTYIVESGTRSEVAIINAHIPITGIVSETIIATDGQTVFPTSASYTTGLNYLNVYVNGVKQGSFTETSTTSFTLDEGVNAGDEVAYTLYEVPQLTGSAPASAISWRDTSVETGLSLSTKNYATVAAMTADATLRAGDTAVTAERTTGNGGGGTYTIIAGTGTANTYNILAHDTLSLSCELRVVDTVNILQVGAIGDSDGTTGNGTDNAGAIQSAIDVAKLSGVNVFIPEGDYRVGDTLDIEGVRGLKIFGRGGYTSQIYFDNATSDKELFFFGDTSSYTEFNGLALVDVTAQTSTAVKMTDKPDTSQPNWKNTFTGCRFVNFKTGHLATDTDPLAGATHTHLDGTLFEQCRFINCGVAYHNQNLQAVNINFVSTDIENSASGESYTMFKDEAGATITVTGGSFIGKGLIYDADYPSGGTNLWQGGSFAINGGRFELRATRTLPLIQIDPSVAFTKTIFENCIMLGFSQSMTLADWAGKGNLIFENCNVLSGDVTLKLYPTSGITGAITGDGREFYGSAVIKDCFGFKYEKQTSSPFGTYDEDVTVPVIVRNQLTSPNGQLSRDASSFSTLNFADEFQRGYGLGNIKEGMIAYNGDKPTVGFQDFKFTLPKGGTPTEMVIFKQPIRRTSPINYKLYFVKDNADWVIPGTFAVGTDGILISDSGSTANKCGLLTFPVELTNLYLDATYYFQSGSAKWLEGRLFLEHSGTASQMVGFVGVRYI